MKAMDILAGDHRQRFFGFRSFILDVYYIVSSPRKPRFVLVPIRFASEAWPRPGLAEPRSASIAGLHQHNRKGKIVMIKTRRYKRLVFGFVFCT